MRTGARGNVCGSICPLDVGLVCAVNCPIGACGEDGCSHVARIIRCHAPPVISEFAMRIIKRTLTRILARTLLYVIACVCACVCVCWYVCVCVCMCVYVCVCICMFVWMSVCTCISTWLSSFVSSCCVGGLSLGASRALGRRRDRFNEGIGRRRRETLEQRAQLRVQRTPLRHAEAARVHRRRQTP
mmetsp:Transcript_53956/g.117694  ORF Transcript_53956/g.117694 Transcript_53956/m.117694 type:complete len:186 (+) Transcript_53956:409-966(+)